MANIYFPTGVFWELPAEFDENEKKLEKLKAGIKKAMEEGTVYPITVKWDNPKSEQTFLFNGKYLSFIAIGDPGHISR